MICQNMRLNTSPLHVRKANPENQSEMQSAHAFTANPAAVKTIEEPSVAPIHAGVARQGGVEIRGKIDVEHQNRLKADEMTSKNPATNPVNINVPQTIAAIRIYG